MCYNEVEVIKMKELPNYYLTLFNAVTNALEALERGDAEIAKLLLQQGQQAAEEEFLSQTC